MNVLQLMSFVVPVFTPKSVVLDNHDHIFNDVEPLHLNPLHEVRLSCKLSRSSKKGHSIFMKPHSNYLWLKRPDYLSSSFCSSHVSQCTSLQPSQEISFAQGVNISSSFSGMNRLVFKKSNRNVHIFQKS